PGRRTAQRIDYILTRLTFGGAIYLSIVCIIPDYLIRFMNVPFYFGGTGLLIVVGVAMDTMAQIESYMVTRHYKGFLSSGKIKGR
ncbi:MAG: preprotein translocase subunit SecY, partial [Nitrospinae bacterium]|nr:preprotein translocase subunit SecY [Nitrospinota bacterium]